MPAGPDASHRIVVLHGKDSYLKVEWTRMLRESLEAAHGTVDEFRFDGAAASLATVLDELRSWGLMGGHKLVIVDSAEAFMGAEDRRRAMERYAESPMAESTLLMRAPTWRPGNFDKMVAKVGVVLKCEPPSSADALRWVIARAEKRHGVPIEQPAAALLVDLIGADLARLDSELGKLALGAAAGKPITRDLVVDFVGASKEEEAWRIQNAVLTGDVQAALEELNQLLRVSRAAEVQLNWSLVDLARKVHDAARLKAGGMPESAIPGAIRHFGSDPGPLLRWAWRLGPAGAGALLRAAVETDMRMKSGGAPEPSRTVEGLTAVLATSAGTRGS